mgnify:CR=1 FL=1
MPGSGEARRLVKEGHEPYHDVENARAGFSLELARRYVRDIKGPRGSRIEAG